MSDLDKGLKLVKLIDTYEAALGLKDHVAYARSWLALDKKIQERAREWPRRVVMELANMDCEDQRKCVAQFDSGDFRTIEGAVLGEKEPIEAAHAADPLTDAMRAMLRASYERLDTLKYLSKQIDCMYQREAIRFNISRIQGVLEAWSQTPKEMLDVPSE